MKYKIKTKIGTIATVENTTAEKAVKSLYRYGGLVKEIEGEKAEKRANVTLYSEEDGYKEPRYFQVDF